METIPPKHLQLLEILITAGGELDANPIPIEFIKIKSGLNGDFLTKAINNLITNGCLINWHGQSKIELQSVGIGTWKDYLQWALGQEANIQVFAQTNSTQDLAKRLAINLSPGQYGLAITEEQTRGRGRLNRTWHAHKNKSLTMSWVKILNKNELNHLEQLTISTAVAVAQGIETASGLNNIKIKWPNDIYIAQKKLAGILIETIPLNNGNTAAIVGVGVNVATQHQDLEQDKQTFQSVSLAEMGHKTHRVHLSKCICQAMNQITKQDYQQTLNQWQQRNDILGKTMAFMNNSKIYRGTVMDLSASDGLILQTQDGAVVHLPAQTTSTHLE